MTGAGPSHGALGAVAAAVRGEGGLLAAVVVDPAPDADRAIEVAIEGSPRGRTIGPDLALAAEATREAELLHHAPEHARVLRTDDRDLALLAGDRLYALGLERLATGGWTGEVAILADIVALVARLHADPAWEIGPAAPGAPAGGTGDPDDARARTVALWATAAQALGGGSDSPAAELLRAVRRGEVPDFEVASAAATPVSEGPSAA